MDKISFKDLTKQILNARYLIVVCMILSLFFGLFIYKITPNEYASKVQFLVSSNETSSSQARLGSLASLAGINLEAPGAGISVPSYEYILASSSFLFTIVHEKIEFEGDSVYIGDYLIQRMVVNWVDKFKSLYQ